MWQRFSTVKTDPTPDGEAVVNLDNVDFWTGHGPEVTLHFSSGKVLRVKCQDTRMEQLTGSHGGFASS